MKRILSISLLVLSGCASASYNPASEGYFKLGNDKAKTLELFQEMSELDLKHCQNEASDLNRPEPGSSLSSDNLAGRRFDQHLCIARLGWYLK